jgi:hypothetical protein
MMHRCIAAQDWRICMNKCFKQINSMLRQKTRNSAIHIAAIANLIPGFIVKEISVITSGFNKTSGYPDQPG